MAAVANILLSGGVVVIACRWRWHRLLLPHAWRALLVLLPLLVAVSVVDLRAQEARPEVVATERGVKAAFLYKFVAYVDWPATAFSQADAPIVIGVMGADDIATELQQITASRTVNNRPIVVRRMHDGDSMAGLHMLFVGRSEAARLPALARAAQQRSVLTVTDSPGALDQGAVINFVMADGRVRFAISVEAADRSGLRLSSRLLAVAQSVRTGAGS